MYRPTFVFIRLLKIPFLMVSNGEYPIKNYQGGQLNILFEHK